MNRYVPLRRTRMVRRPARRIAARAEWQPFRDWLHRHGVCVGEEAFDTHWCEGRIEQSHGPKLALAMKAPEEQSWPACSLLHREWGECIGPFKGWDKAARRAFSDTASEATQAAWLKFKSGNDVGLIPF